MSGWSSGNTMGGYSYGSSYVSTSSKKIEGFNKQKIENEDSINMIKIYKSSRTNLGICFTTWGGTLHLYEIDLTLSNENKGSQFATTTSTKASITKTEIRRKQKNPEPFMLDQDVFLCMEIDNDEIYTASARGKINKYTIMESEIREVGKGYRTNGYPILSFHFEKEECKIYAVDLDSNLFIFKYEEGGTSEKEVDPKCKYKLPVKGVIKSARFINKKLYLLTSSTDVIEFDTENFEKDEKEKKEILLDYKYLQEPAKFVYQYSLIPLPSSQDKAVDDVTFCTIGVDQNAGLIKVRSDGLDEHIKLISDRETNERRSINGMCFFPDKTFALFFVSTDIFLTQIQEDDMQFHKKIDKIDIPNKPNEAITACDIVSGEEFGYYLVFATGEDWSKGYEKHLKDYTDVNLCFACIKEEAYKQTSFSSFSTRK